MRVNFTNEHPTLKMQAYLDILHQAQAIPVNGARSRRRKKRILLEWFKKHQAEWDAKGPDPTPETFRSSR